MPSPPKKLATIVNTETGQSEVLSLIALSKFIHINIQTVTIWKKHLLLVRYKEYIVVFKTTIHKQNKGNNLKGKRPLMRKVPA